METGFMNRITGLVIALVLGSILVGGVLAPTVAGIQTTVGEPITKTNESVEYLTLSDGNVEMSLSSGNLTINDEIKSITSADVLIFASDLVTIYFNGTNFYGTYVNQNSGVRNITAFSISVVNGVMDVSVTYDNNDTQTADDYALLFSFYLDEEGDYSRFVPTQTQPYVSSLKDIVAAGNYYTGTNKTTYWYYNGEAGGAGSSYEYALTGTLTQVNGTYDIYTVSDIKFSIDGEEFTPYHMIVKKNIDGHATAGAYYVMFGVITLLAIIMLVVVAANAIRNKY